MINFKMNVAGIVIAFESNEPGLNYAPSEDKRFAGFEYLGEKNADIRFEIRSNSIDLSQFEGDKKLLFNAEGNWQLYKLNDKLLYEYPERRTGNVERLSLLNSDMKEGIIYNLKDNGKDGPEDAGKRVISEINANFFQVFILDYLIRYKIGILAHGLTLDDNGVKLLFMGRSGSGKSTLARIYSQDRGVRVYNDDRAILKFEAEKTIFYNAPWAGAYLQGYHPHQDDRFAIDKIFFIHHEKENEIRRLTAQEAAASLLRNTFPAFWHREGLMDAIVLCSSVAKKVPCFELGFVNDSRIVEFVRANS